MFSHCFVWSKITSSSNALRTKGSNKKINIWNNVVYIDSSNTASGKIFYVDTNATTTNYIYNNTFVNLSTDSSTFGILRNNGNVIVKNNLAYVPNAKAFWDWGGPGTTLEFTNNAADDTLSNVSWTLINNRSNQTFDFKDLANKNFNLKVTDTGAKGFGVNLLNDVDLPISDDILGLPRPESGAWNIGAFTSLP